MKTNIMIMKSKMQYGGSLPLPHILLRQFFQHFVVHFGCNLEFILCEPARANGGSSRRQEGLFLLEACFLERACGISDWLRLGIALGEKK